MSDVMVGPISGMSVFFLKFSMNSFSSAIGLVASKVPRSMSSPSSVVPSALRNYFSFPQAKGVWNALLKHFSFWVMIACVTYSMSLRPSSSLCCWWVLRLDLLV
jgi:hypothetical protein